MKAFLVLLCHLLQLSLAAKRRLVFESSDEDEPEAKKPKTKTAEPEAVPKATKMLAPQSLVGSAVKSYPCDDMFGSEYQVQEPDPYLVDMHNMDCMNSADLLSESEYGEEETETDDELKASQSLATLAGTAKAPSSETSSRPRPAKIIAKTIAFPTIEPDVASRPSPADQLELIKTICNTQGQSEFVPGAFFYIISSKWLSAWFYLCQIDPDGLQGIILSHIDNRDIVDEEVSNFSTGAVALLLDKKEPIDFTIFPEEVWNLLMKWYGNKGPIIKRKVVEGVKGSLTVEMNLAEVELGCFITGTLDTMSISCWDTVKDLKEATRSFLTENYEHPGLSEQLYFYIKLSGDANATKYALHDDDEETDALTVREIGLQRRDTFLYVDSEPCTEALSLGSSSSDATRERALAPNAGLVGLRNLGNTCYMNSALQCLFNCKPLRRFILSGEQCAQINTENRDGTRGKLLKEFAGLLRSIWTAPPQTVWDPIPFKHAVGWFDDRFAGYTQQDSQEFMASLLDFLHEDINKVSKKPYIETPDHNGRPDSEVAAEAWDAYTRRNDSTIVNLFHGQLKSTVTCPTCHQSSVKFDPFSSLSLPIPSKNQKSALKINIQTDTVLDDDIIGIDTEAVKDIESLKLLILSHVGLSSEQHVVHLFDSKPSGDLIALSSGTLTDLRIHMSKLHAFICRRGRPYGVLTFNDGAKNIGIPLAIPLYKNPKEMGTDTRCTSMVADSLSGFAPHRYIYDEILTVKSTSDWNSPLPSFSVTIEANILQDVLEDVGVEDSQKCTSTAFYHLLLSELQPLPESPDHPAENLNREDLYESLDMFAQEEHLGPMEAYYCSHCKAHRDGATKKMDIWKLPEVLAIHLKRFRYGAGNGAKINDPVSFPVEYNHCEFF